MLTTFRTKCGKQLKIKKNIYAVWAFIFSLILPLGCVISEAHTGLYRNEIIYNIGQFIMIVGLPSTIVSLILFCCAVSNNKICIKKYKLLSSLSIVIVLVSLGGLFIPRIIKAVDSDLCGNSWCSELNTTINMNWNVNPNQP